MILILKKAGSSGMELPVFIICVLFTYLSSGFIVGKRIISLMLGASEISIITLSIPIPSPPVGGRPTSRAFTKSISIGCASSSMPASS